MEQKYKDALYIAAAEPAVLGLNYDWIEEDDIICPEGQRGQGV